MGAPSDQFLRIEYGGPLRSVSLLIMEASLCLFFVLYGGPSNHFFPYYIEAPRSLSSLTIWGPLSDQFHCLLYGSPLRSVSLHAIGGPPQILFFSQNIWGPIRSVSPLTIWGTPHVNLFAYYMGPTQISYCAYFLGAPLRSVFSLTI